MYSCSWCQHSSHTKMGKCPQCGSFWTFVLDQNIQVSGTKKKNGKRKGQWKSLSAYSMWKRTRENRSFALEHKELNRLFNGWVRASGVYLLWGEPWIGKSTLSLQILNKLAENSQACRIAYFSAEEHPDHVWQRYRRLFGKDIRIPFDLFHSHRCEDIIVTTRESKYDVIIVDSIQTITSPDSDAIAWSPAQVRSSSELLQHMAKESNTAVLIIGHVTKGGEIAWPKYLEHIVDVVMYLEWDKDSQLRFLRSKKNRFWSADEVGIFDMTPQWLQAVYNLKERIIEESDSPTIWSVLSVWIDNGRPVLVRVEALLNESYGKFPVRRAIGVDSKRLDLVIAILEKYCNLQLKFLDIYVNIPWERYFRDSGLDLAIAAAIMSQYKDICVGHDRLFIGEIALSGKVSPSTGHTKRVKDFMADMSIYDHKNLTSLSQLGQKL